jgi:hypothetical protein
MPKAFEGMVSSRSSTSAAGPPGEQVILELNPERREKLLELTSWRSLYPGTLNLEVDDAVLELLRDSETVWVEDAHEVRYLPVVTGTDSSATPLNGCRPIRHDLDFECN